MGLLKLIKKNDGEISFPKKGLPPIYSLFVDIFKTGRDAFELKKVKHNDDFIQFTSLNLKIKSYENSISHFYSASDITREMKNFHEKIEDYHKQGFVKIGLFDISDAILLGVGKDNSDAIWRLNGDWGENRPYVDMMAKDIFKFSDIFRESVIELNLKARNIELDSLYKNWGEDFWRIRENNDSI